VTTRYKALLIGNADYPDDPANLPRLEGSNTDITLLRNALVEPGLGLFAARDVTIRTDQPAGVLLKHLARFFGEAESGEVLLLYFSGHGLLDDSRTLHLATHDSVLAWLSVTSISSVQLDRLISDSAARSTVIVLDCCHSGAFKGGGDIVTPVSGRSRYVLACCRGDELAADADQVNHASLFTATLVEGLRAAAGTGEYITMDELYEFTYRRMTALRKQIPQRSAQGEGQLPIARRVATPSGAPRAAAAPGPDAAPPTTRRRLVTGAAAAGAAALLSVLAAVHPSWPAPLFQDPPAPAVSRGPSLPSQGAGTRTPVRVDPAWMPEDRGELSRPTQYQVSVTAPQDQAQIKGTCLEVTGTAALPSGKTLIIGDRNIDGPPDRPFIYTPVSGWDRPPDLVNWHALLSLGSAAGQRYQVAVLVADTAVVRTAWAVPRGMVTSDTPVAGLQLVALLTVKQSTADGRSCGGQ
jgi:hypothetical protein